jgi:hypothetical protein
MPARRLAAWRATGLVVYKPDPDGADGNACRAVAELLRKKKPS